MGRTYLECGCDERYCTCKITREQARKNAIQLSQVSSLWLKYSLEEDSVPLRTTNEILNITLSPEYIFGVIIPEEEQEKKDPKYVIMVTDKKTWIEDECMNYQHIDAEFCGKLDVLGFYQCMEGVFEQVTGFKKMSKKEMIEMCELLGLEHDKEFEAFVEE